MTTYNSIDLVKFVMAICVVTIHTYIVDGMQPSLASDLLHSLIRSAVPFFFITSAYFVMGRMDYKGIVKYLKRILQLYISWSCIIFLCLCFLQQQFSVEKLGITIYQVLFNGYNVLWYLWGLLLGIPILFKIRVGGGKKSLLLLMLGFSAYLFNRVYTHYGSMDNPGSIWSWAVFLYQGKFFNLTNLSLAVTYLSFGSYFAHTKYSSKLVLNIALILLGVFMMHFEVHKDVALGVPFIALGLFPLVKDWVLNISWISFKWLRKMSTLIYFIHVIVIVAVDEFLPNMVALSRWSVIVGICILLSALLLSLTRVKGMGWIAKLY